MKTLKRIISILVIFTLFASFAAVNVNAASTPASLMGKYINFGTFDGNDMVYYVAARDDVNGDAIGDYYLLSANSLMKACLARTNGSARHYNRWSLSDMRVWLNSDAEAGQVAFTNHIEGTTPDANYKDRAGFLNNFTTAERALILPVTHKSVIGKRHVEWTTGAPEEVINITSGTDAWNWGGDVHSGTSAAYYGTHVSYTQGSELSKRWRHLDSYANIDGYTFDKGTDDTSDDDVRGEATKEETTDMVFIPSVIDCYKYKLPLHDLMGSAYAHTWLRDVANGRTDSNYWTHNATFTRDTTSKINTMPVAEQQQIRPAMFIDGSVKYNVTGDGTKANPYTLVYEKACDDLTGKYIYFGEYGETFDGNTEAVTKQPIKWYIAGTKDVDADGVEEYYLIASEAISIKGFTGWSSGSPGAWSTQWASSSLRAWLNSDESDVSAYGKYVTYADGNVVYTDEASATVKKLKVAEPTAATFGNGRGYADEAGFLTNFTAEEKAMITPVTHKYLMGTDGYKDTEATGAGFAGGVDATAGGYFNLLEKYGNMGSGVNNGVPKLIVSGESASNVYQGIHTGRAADNRNDYFWTEAIANINGVRGNNFNTDYFDSKAAYIQTTDTVFVPSLFDVADFGGEMLFVNKQSNNPAFGYQCGAGNPADRNRAGHIWLRDTGFTASSGSHGGNKLQMVYSASHGLMGNLSADMSTNIGVQPAMYISSEFVSSGIGSYEEPLVALSGEVENKDGFVTIEKADNKVVATGYVYNTTAAPETYFLVVAKYAKGEDDTLILSAVSPANTTLDGVNKQTDEFDIDLDFEEGYVYKAFLWKSSNMNPFTPSKTLE